MSKWPKLSLKSPWGRLALVPPSQDDDAEVAALRSDPITLKYVPFKPASMTTDESKKIRETNAKKDEVWRFHIHLVSKSNEEESSPFVGQCTIKDIDLANRAGEIGIILSSNLHRTGIATEALFVLLSHGFEHPELKLHRLQFVTGSNNVQMRGWFENFGIQMEHQLREAWSDGQGGRLDAVGYSILKNEWPDLKTRLEKWLDARIPSRPRISDV